MIIIATFLQLIMAALWLSVTMLTSMHHGPDSENTTYARNDGERVAMLQQWPILFVDN